VVDGGRAEARIAVEIESRVAKQVRGALVDLLWHAAPRKLLLLLPVHMKDVAGTAEQCRRILEATCGPQRVRVLVLSGTGRTERLEQDAALVRDELAAWDVPVAMPTPTDQGGDMSTTAAIRIMTEGDR
jgi:hypothetical protein